MIDAARQRTNMVESQILTSDVTDKRILLAMGDLPRERFVPESLAQLAYMDDAVPATDGAGASRRWLMAPRMFAKLLQLADLGEDDTVLDVGGATGYSAAVLGRIVKSVVALEADKELAVAAQKNLSALAIGNVDVVEGPLNEGAGEKGPYDVIVLGGSVPEPGAALLDQLKDGGRLVAVVRKDDGYQGKATIWRRLGRSLDQWTAFDGAAPDLPGFERAREFVL